MSKPDPIRPDGAPLAQPGARVQKKGFKRALPVLVILGGMAAFFAGGFHDYLSFDALAQHREQLMAWAAANRVVTAALFMGAYAVVVALSLPGAVWMTLAAGFAFGGVEAALYVVFAATLGATALFLAARYAFADLMVARAKRMGGAFQRMESGFRENAFNYLLFLRLVPLFPFWLVNLVPALLDVRLSTFVVATFFGIIPGTVVFAHVGAGLGVALETGARLSPGEIIMQPGVFLPFLGLAFLSLVPVAYQKLRKGKRPS